LPTMNDKRHIERQQESKRILERVERDSEAVGTSNLARTADRVAGHFRADQADKDDPIEVLGTRIGRGLGLIAFIGLAVYLFFTYVLK
jgi:hypothetical protein